MLAAKEDGGALSGENDVDGEGDEGGHEGGKELVKEVVESVGGETVGHSLPRDSEAYVKLECADW